MDKKNILIAEDDTFAQLLYKSIFDGLFDFDIAETGKKAYELAEEKYYDLIIIDIHMPEMNGIELLIIVKKT